MSNYRVIDKETYYRKGVFRHFSEDCKCSTSMTARVDVTALAAWSKQTGTKFYVNFLYLLTKVLNSRDDYRMGYLWQTDELICYDQINPTQYVFHEIRAGCGKSSELVRRLLYFLAVLRFSEHRTAGRISVFCSHCKLGQIPGGKRKTNDAGECPVEPRHRRRVPHCQGIPAA